ncbi:MAG: cytochrome P450 [Croceicoccus sp.]|jgi:cytochrome P450|nr:cytochrome P450 [Croceicoccus sp.]MAL27808.1 cytochrome P450 [Croceicoccus sp.]|tara:strand:+ start:71656 stop:72954 length:1299 start_codon:yes stop_codon:yes gene_type:complete
MTGKYNAMLDQMVRDYSLVTHGYSGVAPANPYPMFEEKRAKCPVMHGDLLQENSIPSMADYMMTGRPVVTLYRYNDIHSVLMNPDDWLSYIVGDGFGAAVDNLLLTAMDGEEHTKYRKTLQKPFMRGQIRKLMETLIRPVVVNEFVEKLRPNGKADLLREFALPFPIRAMYAYFGFPHDEDLLGNLASWAIQVVAAPQTDPEVAKVTIPQSMVAGQSMFETLMPIVQQYRARGEMRNDILGYMMTTEHEGEKFSDEDIANFIRMLLLAAGETTTRSFANMMVQLLEEPDVLEELRQDRSLVPKAVMETMRRDPTAGAVARIAARDMEIGGMTIPKGTAVLCSIASANRDPEVYDDPDRLWLKRPMRPLLSFGFGPHMCLGMHMALTEMEVALEEILDLPGLRFDPAYPKPEIRGLNMRGPDALHVLWDVDGA